MKEKEQEKGVVKRNREGEEREGEKGGRRERGGRGGGGADRQTATEIIRKLRVRSDHYEQNYFPLYHVYNVLCHKLYK